MDFWNSIVTAPNWANQLCYYYLAVAAIMTVYGVWALSSLFLLPAAVQKNIPVIATAIGLIVSVGVAIVLTMLQFWICRGALAAREKFAVRCKSDRDCKAVMGEPQNSSVAECGAAGYCGGYVMRNNMEPQPCYDALFTSPAASGAVPIPAA